jgi:hypothetical protein
MTYEDFVLGRDPKACASRPIAPEIAFFLEFITNHAGRIMLKLRLTDRLRVAAKLAEDEDGVEAGVHVPIRFLDVKPPIRFLAAQHTLDHFPSPCRSEQVSGSPRLFRGQHTRSA